jgi:fido (protein-threonine AMPylation protein)
MGEEGSANRYEASLDELSADQRAFAENTLAAAASTFANFADAEESHYFCARGRTPEETWLAVTTEVARVTAILAAQAEAGHELSVDDVDAVHRGIFRPVFGEETLRMRRHREQVEYGIVLGPRNEPRRTTQLGKSAKSLRRSLAEALAALHSAIEARDRAVARGVQRQILDATRPAAAFYGRFLADHPYMDGNGRTAFPLLSFALIRLGLLAVAVPESSDFHWCLGRAMRRSGRDPEPLAIYLRDLIRSSTAAEVN